MKLTEQFLKQANIQDVINSSTQQNDSERILNIVHCTLYIEPLEFPNHPQTYGKMHTQTYHYMQTSAAQVSNIGPDISLASVLLLSPQSIDSFILV